MGRDRHGLAAGRQKPPGSAAVRHYVHRREPACRSLPWDGNRRVRSPRPSRLATRGSSYDAAVRLIDSHCHVNADRFADDAEQVLANARAAGVERVLVPGWNVASCERARDLAERIDWIDIAVGVHPHDAAKVDDSGWQRIGRWARDPRVKAIGETGLDYDRVFSPILE